LTPRDFVRGVPRLAARRPKIARKSRKTRGARGPERRASPPQRLKVVGKRRGIFSSGKPKFA
jgi:hypothetical protein